MRLAGLVLLTACGNGAAAPDAPGAPPPIPPTIAFHLGVGLDGGRHLPLSIWIDGTQTNDLHEDLDRSQMYPTVTHSIELRYQDTVLFRSGFSGKLTPCEYDGSTLLSYDVSFGELDSGDVRPYGATIVSQLGDVHEGCAEDGFGYPDCNCGAGEHCEPRVELDSPRFTRLACAPIGPKQHGDACTFTADPTGAYDDCGASMFCFQGTCHTMCLIDPGNPSQLPPPSDEYPREVALCD
jgi:hypothetical protein